MNIERKIGQKSWNSDPWSPHRPTRRQNKRKVREFIKNMEKKDELLESQSIILANPGQNSKGDSNAEMAPRNATDDSPLEL